MDTKNSESGLQVTYTPVDMWHGCWTTRESQSENNYWWCGHMLLKSKIYIWY